MGPTRRSGHSTYMRSRDTPQAEETEVEAETSQRQRRPRGRPRREPSTDHERGSSRSSRDDDGPLPTVGEEAAPQMYDEEVVPHTSEEGAGGVDFLCSLQTLLAKSQPAPEATDSSSLPPTDCTRGG